MQVHKLLSAHKLKPKESSFDYPIKLRELGTIFSNMGDLKDAGQAGDGANAPTQENMETVEIGNPPSEQDLITRICLSMQKWLHS
ncbi:hypothetical protein CEXT_251931 [Caerostris extrusa]|uniref:Uncharacterized protein n=1 Tax=Caerostris extrusa TaxID=172846 RepID=A0AAV4WBB9_CAEEX|nr:hypothetical protein CEXT_251931 [Caerostris extrusa]